MSLFGYGGGSSKFGKSGLSFKKKARGNNYRNWSSAGVSQKSLNKFKKSARSHMKRGMST